MNLSAFPRLFGRRPRLLPLLHVTIAVVATVVFGAKYSLATPFRLYTKPGPYIPLNNDNNNNNEGDDDFEELANILLIALAVLGGVFGVFCVALLTYCVRHISRLGDLSLDTVELSDEQVQRLLSDENSRQNYQLAQEFERLHPYDSARTRITPEQEIEIYEKGVHAWEFTVNLDVNALLQDKTEVLFMGGDNCVQTNLPIPRTNPVYYFEIKVTEKPTDVNMWIGVASKPYPTWRMTGWNKYSVGYSVNSGVVHKNYQFTSIPIGEQCFAGDIVGVGYQPHSGYIWFTRNGRKFRTIMSGMMYDLFPTISADGPSSFSANFGQRGFVYIEANVKRWGLAPLEGAQSPPPLYGMDENTILLETGISSYHRPLLQSSPLIALDDGRPATDAQGTSYGNNTFDDANVTTTDSHSNIPLPPAYAEEDPIAKELLEAGNTELFDSQLYRDRYGKRVQTNEEVSYQNGEPTIDPQDQHAHDNTSNKDPVNP